MIYRLFVRPEDQRQGAGTALIRRACALLAKSGRPEVALWVLEEDTSRARPFYESLGWHHDGSVRPFDRDLGPDWVGRLNTLRYRWTVPTA